MILTASKTKTGKEGRLFCARTTVGGLTWIQVAWIGDEPAGFRIMPSTVKLAYGDLLTAARTRGPSETNWSDLYQVQTKAPRGRWRRSRSGVDRCARRESTVDGSDAKMRRLCLTLYGYQGANRSASGLVWLKTTPGRPWGDEIVRLRPDGAWWDLGYVRSVERPDGKIVTVYYFNDQPSTERFIEATIWRP